MVRFFFLALGCLAGCTLTHKIATAPQPTGPLKGISALVSSLSSDASGDDYSTICSSVLSTALEKQLNSNGGCTKDISNQVATASSFTLSIVKYGAFSGNTALAVVKSIYNGKNQLATLHLVKQAKGGWRISSLS